MITTLANMIADFFARHEYIEYSQREVYTYGCEALLSMLINSAIVIISGILMNELLMASIFFAVFIVMRKYCGGYHAKSHWKCHTVFSVNILFVLLFAKYERFVNITFLTTAIILSNLIVIWISPIVNENKPLDNNTLVKNRLISIVLCLTLSSTSVLLLFFNRTVSIIIISALLSVSLAMFITKPMEETEMIDDES